MSQQQAPAAPVIPEWLQQGDPNEYLAVTFTRGEVVQLLQLLPHLRKVPTMVTVVKDLRDVQMPDLRSQMNTVLQAASVAEEEAQYPEGINDLREEVAAMREELAVMRDSGAAAPKRSRAKKVEVPEAAPVPPAPVGMPAPTMPAAVAVPVPTAPVMPTVAPVTHVAAVPEVPVHVAQVPAATMQPVPQVGEQLMQEAGKSPADASEIAEINAQIAALGIGAPL